jgi:hypothetical protein
MKTIPSLQNKNKTIDFEFVGNSKLMKLILKIATKVSNAQKNYKGHAVLKFLPQASEFEQQVQ